MAIVTNINDEVLRPSPRANPDRKEITSGLTSAFLPGKRRVYTATASLLPTESYAGFQHSNEGAAGTIILTLPDALPGMMVQFLLEAAQTITVNPQDADQIEGGLTDAAGDSIGVAVPAIGDRITLVCTEVGSWLPVAAAEVGTWADTN